MVRFGAMSEKIDTLFGYLSPAANTFRSKRRVSFYVCLSCNRLCEELPCLRSAVSDECYSRKVGLACLFNDNVGTVLPGFRGYY